MNERAVRRATLPLTARDEKDLASLQGAPEYARTMAEALGLEPESATDVTESVLLHFIFTRGLRSLQEEIEEAAYDRLAQEQEGTAAQRRKEARRRRPSWADEQ